MAESPLKGKRTQKNPLAKAWRLDAQRPFTFGLHIVVLLAQRDVYRIPLAFRIGRRKDMKGYHRRSLAETTFFRCKTLFGPTLRARAFPQQATELFLKAAALNRMTHLGMPDSYRLAT
jgi:hypothetical protein